MIPPGWRLAPEEPSLMMCEAACEGHYGKRRTRRSGGASGVVMTVADQDYSFSTAFRRMWKAAIAASPPPPEVGDENIDRAVNAQVDYILRAMGDAPEGSTLHDIRKAAFRAALAALSEPTT